MRLLLAICFFQFQRASSQFPEHTDFQKLGEVFYKGEKYNILKETTHSVRDHFKDFMQRREIEDFPTKKVFLDKNGFRHYWSGLYDKGNFRKVGMDRENVFELFKQHKAIRSETRMQYGELESKQEEIANHIKRKLNKVDKIIMKPILKSGKSASGTGAKPKAKEADKPKAKEADKPKAKEADKPKAKEADKPKAKEANKPKAKETDKPKAKEADKPKAKEADKPKAKEADKRKAKEADKPKAKEADKPKAKEADKPKAKDADKPKAKEADKPKAKESDKPKGKEADKPKAKEAPKSNSDPKKLGDQNIIMTQFFCPYFGVMTLTSALD